MWDTHVRTTLTTVMQSSDAEARQAAIDFIHVLAARGYLAFQENGLPTAHSL